MTPFWQQLLSGKDNVSPAFGRVAGAALGAMMGVVFFTVVPLTVGVVLLLQAAPASTRFAFLTALGVYLVAASASVGALVVALVSGTAFTEPPARP